MEKKFSEFMERENAVANGIGAGKECMTFEERRQASRLFFQNTFLPEIVNAVKSGDLPHSELLNKQGWKFYLNMVYGESFVFEWDKFEANAYGLDENLIIVTYKYPMPKVELEYIFAATIIDKSTNAADSYFLEYYNPNEWHFGSSTRSDYNEHEPVATPDMDEFADWVVGQRGYLA